MADETAFLDLVKPTGGEAVEVRVINENMDKIDVNAKAVDDKLKDRANLGVIPAVASKAARDALIPAPVAGDRVFRLDSKAEEYHDGTSWWRADGVMEGEIPSGGGGTGVTQDPDGRFIIASGTGYRGANKVFVSKYRRYEIEYFLTAPSAGVQLSMRLAVNNVEETAVNSHVSTYGYINNTAWATARASTNAAVLSSVSAVEYSGSFEIANPMDALKTQWQGDGAASEIYHTFGGMMATAAAYDGIRLVLNNAYSGWFRVRGLV